MMQGSPSTVTTIVRVAAATGAILALGYADYVSGHELSFAIFYVFPVGWRGWQIGWRTAFAMAVLSSVTWHVSNLAAGAAFQHVATPYWNTATRFAFFVVIVFLLARVRCALENERKPSRTDALTVCSTLERSSRR
jgi:hypothetical protein